MEILPLTIELTWFNDEKTILLATFANNWTLDDYHQMIDRGSQQIKAQPHIVHIMYDMTDVIKSPTDLVVAGRYAEKKLPPNQGIVIFVGANAVIRAFVAMGQRMNLKAARHVYTVATFEDGLQIIKEKAKPLSI